MQDLVRQSSSSEPNMQTFSSLEHPPGEPFKINVNFHNLLVLTQAVQDSELRVALRRGTVVVQISKPEQPGTIDARVVEVIPLANLKDGSPVIQIVFDTEAVRLQDLLAKAGSQHKIVAALNETGLHFTQDGERIKAANGIAKLLELSATKPEARSLGLVSKLELKPLYSQGIICENVSSFVDLLVTLERGIDLPGLGLPDDRLMFPQPTEVMILKAAHRHGINNRTMRSTTGLILSYLQSWKTDELLFFSTRIELAAPGSPKISLQLSENRDAGKRCLALSVSCGEDPICLDVPIAEKLGLRLLPTSQLDPVVVHPALRNMLVLDLNRMFAGSSFRCADIIAGFDFGSNTSRFSVVRGNRSFKAELRFCGSRDPATTRDGILSATLQKDLTVGTLSMSLSSVDAHGDNHHSLAIELLQEFLDCCRKQNNTNS